MINRKDILNLLHAAPQQWVQELGAVSLNKLESAAEGLFFIGASGVIINSEKEPNKIATLLALLDQRDPEVFTLISSVESKDLKIIEITLPQFEYKKRVASGVENWLPIEVGVHQQPDIVLNYVSENHIAVLKQEPTQEKEAGEPLTAGSNRSHFFLLEAGGALFLVEVRIQLGLSPQPNMIRDKVKAFFTKQENT